jgi:DNA repair protein RadC
MYMIREMPKDERPRERLRNHGVTALSDLELLSILIRTGHKDVSVKELSENVLYHLESTGDLRRVSFEELMTIKGIKDAKAATILAAVELGRRLSDIPKERRVRITSAADVYLFFKSRMTHLEQEHFHCLYLNTKSEIIKDELLFIGTVNQTVIHPREIFKKAVRVNASAILFVHNHPTGDATPSDADVRATKNLQKSGELMGIHVIDHIVIGKDEYHSIMTDTKTRL